MIKASLCDLSLYYVWLCYVMFRQLTETHSHTYLFFVEAVFLPKLECGPMPIVMVALPNIGGALCSTPQSLADAHY